MLNAGKPRWDKHNPDPLDPCTLRSLHPRIPAPWPLGEVTPRSGVRSQPCCAKSSRQHYPERGVPHPNSSPFMHTDGVAGGQPVFAPDPFAAVLAHGLHFCQ